MACGGGMISKKNFQILQFFFFILCYFIYMFYVVYVITAP